MTQMSSQSSRSPTSADHSPHPQRPTSSYWRWNLSIVLALLAVWFLVGYAISILWIDQVNLYRIGQLPVGFWFAQQGSILTFVVLVWCYAFLLDRVDRKFVQRDK